MHLQPHFFQTLLAEPPRPVEELEVEVEQYVEKVYQLAREGDWIDIDLVQALGSSSLRLLELITPECPPERRALIQAAVRYFTLSDDAQQDFATVFGFDDDAAVLGVVAEYLGRSDLVVLY